MLLTFRLGALSVKSDSTVRVKPSMKIGELSRRCEVSVRMLRYYEEQGLLKPQRSQSGFREYGPREQQTVERIKLLGSAGMTLTTIKQFLPCIRGEGHLLEPCEELRSTLIGQIALIDQKTEKLMHSRKVLERFLLEVQ